MKIHRYSNYFKIITLYIFPLSQFPYSQHRHSCRQLRVLLKSFLRHQPQWCLLWNYWNSFWGYWGKFPPCLFLGHCSPVFSWVNTETEIFKRLTDRCLSSFQSCLICVSMCPWKFAIFPIIIFHFSLQQYQNNSWLKTDCRSWQLWSGFSRLNFNYVQARVTPEIWREMSQSQSWDSNRDKKMPWMLSDKIPS